MSAGGADVVISGIGAVTPVGAGAAQTCASIRAGLTGLRHHPSYYAILPEPVVEPPDPIACGLAFEQRLTGEREPRLLQLALGAIRDLIGSSRLGRAETSALQLWVCLGGAERPGFPALDPAFFTHELPRRLGVTFQQPIKVSADGQTAVFRAAAEAREQLAGRGGPERALVLAVDSLVDDDVLLWFDRRDRLRSARTLDGFLPGEAAACFLVERGNAVEARGGSTLALVSGVGLGNEPNTIAGEANSTGQGLCHAIQAGTRAWAGQALRWAVCDMNGESFGAYEWAIASSRLGELLGATALWHPADCMGAVGCASSALSVVLAARAFQLGYAPDDRVLLWCSSDGAERAACALSAPAPSVDSNPGR